MIFEIVRFSECLIRHLKAKKDVEIDFTVIKGSMSEKKSAVVLYALKNCPS